MSNEYKTSKRGVVVGIFIILGITFLVGGVLTIGNLHSTFQRKIHVSTVFTDVNGLTAGNNIWFSGVKVGTVKRLEFVGTSKVRIIMNINSESHEFIRKDAKVKISSDGLIGNKILVIYGGTPAAGAINEGDRLENESALSTDDIMATLQSNNLNILMLTDKLAKGEGTLGKLLTEDDIYKSLAATSKSLQDATSGSTKLIATLNSYASNLNKKGTLANDLVSDTMVFHNLRGTMAELKTVADNASAMVVDLKEAAKNPNSPMGVLLRDENAGAQLKQSITNLEKATVILNQDLEAAQSNFLLRKGIKKQKAAAEKSESSGN